MVEAVDVEMKEVDKKDEKAAEPEVKKDPDLLTIEGKLCWCYDIDTV